MTDIINPMRELEDIGNIEYDANKKHVLFSKDWNDLKICIDSILEVVNGGIEPPPEPSTLLNGLIRAYNLNGDCIDDISGQNGTPSNITFDTTNAKLGQCAHFSGSMDSNISISNTNLPIGSSAFSVGVVFKTTADGQAFYGWGGTSPYGARNSFGIWGGGKLYFSGFGNDLNSNVVVNDGNLHSAVVTYESGTLKLYLDGSLVATGSISLNVQETAAYIGRNYQSDPFNGYMDMLYIWNRAISASEALEYHNLSAELT